VAVVVAALVDASGLAGVALPPQPETSAAMTEKNATTKKLVKGERERCI
jgi:hypothetical protein